MQSVSSRSSAANSLLALYAVSHRAPLGRVVAEPDDETRFPFQRDRGRIIHAQAFRRLLGKTQVFVAGEGDHYRTRLTHTLEVAQIARDIARTLRLNEDLTECIALAHDLGHPPFGHMGEYAIDAWMHTHESSFEHNEQSLRVVTTLERHGSTGLNLSQEILEGLMKHRLATDRGGRALSLDAQVVNLADEIAYTAHDCDDGLRAGLFAMADLAGLPLIDEARALQQNRGTGLRGAIIHLLVTDLYAETEKRLKEHRVAAIDDVYGATVLLVGVSASTRKALTDIRAFLFERMYSHPQVLQKSEEGQRILRELCDTLFTHPTDKILALQELTKSTLPEAVKDYVAGMTDAYARDKAKAKD